VGRATLKVAGQYGVSFVFFVNGSLMNSAHIHRLIESFSQLTMTDERPDDGNSKI